MKWVFIAVFVILLAALIGETIYLYNQFDKYSALSSDHSKLAAKLKILEDEKVRLEAENSDRAVEVGRLTQEKTSLTVKSEEQAQALIDLTSQIATLTPKLETKTDQANKLRAEVNSLKKKYMCDSTMAKPDFSSNDQVSKALVKYVERTKRIDEPVSAHYWNQIWTGEKYSIHTIEAHSEKDRVTYVWKFTVYFRGESYGTHENGIFYNDDQCWLYLDK